MNLEEKRKANKDFIKNKFTYGTYAVLLVFHQNITRMINLIELRIIFLKRIESGEVKHTLPEEELTQKKLYGYNSPLYLIIVFIFAYLRGWEQVLADKMKMARANDKRLR